jgi:hydrophobic/amphiphilic exporter-1 (mainly G- bacteria), HAE1 family
MNKIIDRPVLATIFFVLIIIFGLYSFKNMPIELVPNPDEGLPSLFVYYGWTGASPDMILKRALIPAEEEIMQIKGVEELESWAGQNRGWLQVEFSRNTRMNFANVVLKERLNRLKKDMPQQIQGPYIQPRIPNEFAQKALFRIGIYGENYSLSRLRKIADREIVPRLKAISGIESVELHGGVEQEIKIQTLMSRLRKHDIDIRDIQTKLAQYFYTQKSLAISKHAGEVTLALSENPEKIDDLRNIVIKNTGDKKIYLKDIAHVFMGFEKQNEERRYQGQSYVQVELHKEPNYSHLEMSNRVRAKLKQLANKMDGKIEFVIQSDDSKVLKTQLMKLGKISFLILAIIFIILFIIVRDIKASMLIFSSVFFSVCATLTAIFLFKIPLNLLTMSGLALGFGLFVDNAVVVFDSILRFREKGASLKESAVEGARAVILPVLSSTFTTIIVFFSFALLFKDRLRIYYLPLAYIIAISLLSSIVVSFVLIPSLSARIKLKLKKDKKSDGMFKKGKFFPFILRYPLVIIVPIIVIFFFSLNTFLEEVSFGRFFGWYSDEKVQVGLRFPAGTEFEDVKKSILDFEKVALEKPYKKEINVSIRDNRASMEVTFPPEIEATSFPVQLKQELVGVATNLAGVGVSVSGFDQEPYFYSPNTGSHLPFSIQVAGYNFEKLMDFSGNVKQSLLGHKRIKEAEVQTDMRYWWGAKSEYYSLKLSREKLKAYNIPPRFLLYILSTVLRENSRSNRLKFDEKELFVEIKASDVDEIELKDILSQYHTIPGQETPFRINDLIEIDLTLQKGGITRENQEYKSMVQWDYLGSAKSGDRFHKTRYKKLEVPVGFKKSLKEQTFRLTEEEQTQLGWAFIISIGLIYLILGMLYENFLQPILIMLSLPLAAIGVFIAFWQLDYSWDSTAWIGAILLSGIVVNNAILLIDNINQHLKKSKKIVEAIAIGTKERIRPIFMTTLTTVLGMMPMVIFRDSGTKSDIWSSLALCTVGGLTSSALLILFVLPIFYYFFYKFQSHLVSPNKKMF